MDSYWKRTFPTTIQFKIVNKFQSNDKLFKPIVIHFLFFVYKVNTFDYDLIWQHNFSEFYKMVSDF